MARVLSGIRPSGDLHIGNYMGAIRQWVELQKTHDCFLMVADYHAMTTPFEPARLRQQTLETVAWFLAAGVDPKRVTLFVQSQMSEHAELAWIFNTLTPLGELYRMTQFKEKSEQQKTRVMTGLLTYPLLMAADILLYQANLVPVGEDQVQHVELTRAIARRFNHRYGRVFTEPTAQLTDANRVMSLTNPNQKMSKTGAEGIALSDPPAVIKEKVMKAVTDPGPSPAQPPGSMSPGVKNLFVLAEMFCDRQIYNRLLVDYQAGTLKYVALKENVATALIKHLTPLQKEYKKIIRQSKLIDQVLSEGRSKAQPIVQATLEQVKEKLGLA